MTPKYLVMSMLLAFTGSISGCVNCNNTVIIVQRGKVDATVSCVQNGLPYSDDYSDDFDRPDSGFELARSNSIRPAARTGGRRRSHRPRNTLTEASYFRR